MSSIQFGWNTIDDSPYGATVGSFTTKKEDPQFFIDAVALGLSRMRFNRSAILIETANGVFNWSILDDAVYQANKVGLRVTFPIREFGPKGGGTSWATYTTPCESGGTHYFGTPTNFANFVVAVGQRYSADGNPKNVKAPDGSGRALWIDNIEIGNEDYDCFGSTTGGCRDPMRYVLYARTMIAALRAPVSSGGGGWTRRIGMWGMFWQNQTHIRDVMNTLYNPPTNPTYNPGGDHSSVIALVDYVNFHNYQNPAYGGTVAQYAMDIELDDIRAIMNANGDAAKPIWVTEFGADGPCAGVSQAAQSTYYDNGSGTKGALATARDHGAQHVDLFTMGYTATTTTGYLGDAKSIACRTSSGTPVRFQAWTTVQTFIKNNPVWPFGFGVGPPPPPPPPPPVAGFTVAPSTLTYSATTDGGNPPSQNVTLTNTGAVNGTWTSSMAGGSWFSATNTSGSLSAGNSVQDAMNVNTSGLSSGTYHETATFTFTPSGDSPINGSCLATLSLAVSPPPPPPPVGGSLVGTFAAQGPGTVDLTAEGTDDWAHWGLSNATTFDHKATGGTHISNFSVIGNAVPVQNSTTVAGFGWSDGTPNGSVTGTTTGSKALPPSSGGGGGGTVSKRFYVMTSGAIYAYDMDNGFLLINKVNISQLGAGIRGCDCHPGSNTIYMAYGSDSGSGGGMLAYNMLTDAVTYAKTYSHGIDQMAVTPDGSAIYMPGGELISGGTWYVINPATGLDTGKTITGGTGPHNTVASLDGKKVYLGPRFNTNLHVYTIATGAMQLIGPVTHGNGIRPFVFNHAQTWVAITLTGYMGFQVADLSSGAILFTVPITGFTWGGGTVTCPCHGISLSPDESELYLLDWPNNYVHVYDVSGLPGSAPTQVANIHLTRNFNPSENPCGYDCLGDGWLLHSLDGKYVFVGDSGNIIDTASRTVAFNLDPLYNTRHGFLEVDFQNGVAIATSTHFGLGRK